MVGHQKHAPDSQPAKYKFNQHPSKQHLFGMKHFKVASHLSDRPSASFNRRWPFVCVTIGRFAACPSADLSRVNLCDSSGPNRAPTTTVAVELAQRVTRGNFLDGLISKMRPHQSAARVRKLGQDYAAPTAGGGDLATCASPERKVHMNIGLPP